MFTLVIFCLTTSNLPSLMDLTFRFLCYIAPNSIGHFFCHQSHPQLGIFFCFGSIPSFFLELFLHHSTVAYWHLLTWGVPLSVSYHFAFSYCSCWFQGKNTEGDSPSLLQWTTLCQTSPSWPSQLGRPHRAWFPFIELNKAVVLVWFYWLDFCDSGFIVSAFWCHLATPTILCEFFLPWTRCISSLPPLLTLNLD